MGYRYIGSKEKLATTIIDYINDDCPHAHSVIDLMAGTGLMSLALRNRGYCVKASDVMTYSYHHLKVNLLLNMAPAFEGLNDLPLINPIAAAKYPNSNYERALAYLNELHPLQGYFFNEFSPAGHPTDATKPRMYFSPKNAAKIDAIRYSIKQFHEDGRITDIEHSLLLHTLILCVNDIANIAGTYGHYLSHFVQRALDPIILKPCDFEANENVDHEVRIGYAEELAHQLSADVCYIDPPYIKRQYAANYHILETLAREDTPHAIGESGLRPWRDQYSNFCSKVKIRDSFDKIIRDIDCNEFFISYSEDGLLNHKDLISFLSNYGNVESHEILYKRFKSRRDNPNQKGPDITEYLIHLSI